ncbi:MAG: hypothetical protein FWG43_05835, partial [Clostridiales bacterium]|nr:hypothetical protein [Clostridiales bacterium]
MKTKIIILFILPLTLILLLITSVAAAELPYSLTFAPGLAITADGALWQWDTQNNNNLSSPEKILDNAVMLALSDTHSLSVKSDGSLWALGENNKGQIGDGTTMKRVTPVRVLDNVISIAASKDCSLAVKSDGSLWVWGENPAVISVASPLPVKVMDDVVSVYAGKGWSFAIKSDTSLWQINGSTAKKIMDNAIYFAGGFGFGGLHGLVIKSDGTLWAWGMNNVGQLGDGTNENRQAPIKIMDNVQAVAAGEGRSLAVTN